jgi:glycosyltransferase involved in cell wall biosynthesis
MGNPLVSVIIPVYNGEKYLGEAVQSVLEQDYRPLEIIVVDDGSTDRSAEIASSYAEVRYFHQENQGVSAARNAAIAMAMGEFLAFLDADDRWTPNKLSVQIGYHLAHPDIGYTITHQRIQLEPGAPVQAAFKRELLETDHPGYVPSTLMVKQQALQTIGDFQTRYRTGEDIDWFSRAKDSGIPMGIVPEMLLFRRMHHSNLSLQGRPNFSQLLRSLKTSIDRKSS